MKYDKTMVAGIIGAISTIPYEIVTRLAVYFGIGKYSVYNLSSLIVTINRPTAILGAVVSMVLGSAIAMILYYAIRKVSSDYVVYKGLFGALLSWVIMETIYVWLIEGPGRVTPRPVEDYYLELIGSIVFGVTMGQLFKRYLLNEPGGGYRVK